jgi:hypothetical protein
MATYNYSVSGDFPAGCCAGGLRQEVLDDAAITTTLTDIKVTSDNCAINFESALSGAEETALDAVVAASSGDPAPLTIDDYSDCAGAAKDCTTGEKAFKIVIASDGAIGSEELI